MIRTVVRRFAARPLQTKNIVRTFETPEEALEFYERNSQLAVGQLEPVLSQIAFLQTNRKSDADSLFSDERFTRLLLQVTSDMENCESAGLVRFAQAAAKLSLPRGGSTGITELSRKIGEVATKRVNAFSPSDLASLCFGLGTRGYSDPEFVDFVRMETMKMVQDFSPESAIMMLEAFRRMNVFNRELVDNLVERLTDEVDRFTSKDIVNCVTVFAKIGIGRGFLLRRLSRLSFENLNLFTPVQLVRLLSGFAKLRFLTSAGVDEILASIESAGISKLAPAQAADALFAVAMSEYRGDSTVVTRLIDTIGANLDIVSITNLVDAAWALSALDEDEQFRSLLSEMANRIFTIPPPSNRQLLLKALELAAVVDSNIVSSQWRSAMDDAEKLEMNRFESARLHSEVLALIESIKPSGAISEKLALQRGAQAGGFRVDFLDVKHKLSVDIDTLSRPTTLGLRHRLLKAQGYAPVRVGYWDIRRMKTFEEQQEWLRAMISKALRTRA